MAVAGAYSPGNVLGSNNSPSPKSALKDQDVAAAVEATVVLQIKSKRSKRGSEYTFPNERK